MQKKKYKEEKSFVFDKHIFHIFNNFPALIWTFTSAPWGNTWILFYLSIPFVNFSSRVRRFPRARTFLLFLYLIFLSIVFTTRKRQSEEKARSRVVKETFYEVIDISDMEFDEKVFSPINRCGKMKMLSFSPSASRSTLLFFSYFSSAKFHHEIDSNWISSRAAFNLVS